MTELLTRIFIRNRENISDPAVRRQYGTLSGTVGIVLNLLLFAGKFLAGTLAGSIAITADAFNNLSDAGSSVVTLIGFRLAGQKPDRSHPFGHGRIEYLSGLAVSVVILVMGFELGRSSLDKILHPAEVTFSLLPCIILGVSILVKGWMSLFNRRLGNRIHSAAMQATAADSLSDAVSTTAVLAGTLIGHFSGAMLDGWLGLLVAAFILYTGFGAMRDTIGPLLGQAPDPELVEGIRRIVLEAPEILGIHDLIVHDYGPGRLLASLHAEISRHADIMQAHDVIDNIERRIYHELHCETTIHMDPIADDDERLHALRETVSSLLQEIDPALTCHDFRITDGPSHTNLIFDVVKPLDCRFSNDDLLQKIKESIGTLQGHYYAVITIDTPRI